MEIFKAGAEDIDALIEKRLDFFREEGELTPENEAPLCYQLRAYFEKHLAAGDFIGVLGRQDGAVVASAYLSILEHPPKPENLRGKSGYICNVYVAPRHRGGGCATRLMEALMALAKTQDVHDFDLIATPAGRGMYERLGYHTHPYTYMLRHPEGGEGL